MIPQPKFSQMAENPAPRLRQIQERLHDLGEYRGPRDGLPSAALTDAIRRYSHHEDGNATEALLQALESGQEVRRLLKRLATSRDQQISAARKALAADAQSEPLIQRKPESDPSLGAGCGQQIKPRCVLVEALAAIRIAPPSELKDWALSDIVAALARTGLSEQARSTLGLMSDPRSILAGMVTIARNQALSGLIETGAATAAAIPDPAYRAEALTAIAKVQPAAEDPAGAVALARTLTEASARDPILITAAQAFARSGDLETAHATALFIHEARYRAVALANLAGAAAKSGHFSLFRSTIAAATTITEQITLPYARSFAETRIVTAWAEAGNDIRALRLAKAVRDRVLRVESLWTVANAKPLKAATRRRAQVLALATAGTIADPLMRTRTLCKLAQDQRHRGDHRSADHLIRQALDTARVTAPSWQRARALAMVAAALAK